MPSHGRRPTRIHRIGLPGAPLAGLAALIAAAAFAVPPASGATAGQRCEARAAAALRSCTTSVARQTLGCFSRTGAGCLPGDSRLERARTRLEGQVLRACPDAATVASAGYPATLTPAGLVERLRVTCEGDVASLVARSFGGPHAAARQAASGADRDCLDYAYGRGRTLLDYAYQQQSRCIVAAHAGRTCDPATVASKIATREARSNSQIVGRCPVLASLIGLDPASFLTRARHQADCAVPIAHGSSSPLTPACGPRPAITIPPPATNLAVQLDSNSWGTRCGNGTDYKFWIRLAPAGQPVGNVVVFLEGGGGCYDGPGCQAVATSTPDRLEALSDGMGSNGILSNTDATNPFQNWTKVFLPYCTQDLHIGGGVTNAFPEITVHRYGARNVRTALEIVRDTLWTAMDATDAEGFRPDRLKVVLSGSSAGGYGAVYNYHWVLDDLRWSHTTAVPDAALGMDNGALGVIALGTIALLPTTPGWGTLPFVPPYCLTPECTEIFVNLETATAPRLGGEPEQQILNVSNQIDNTQRNTTLFATNADFVNTLRASHCSIQGTPGVHSFLRASSTSIHGQIATNAVDSASIGGTLLRDWLGAAIGTPAATIDKIATGGLETTIPGVNPFPCSVGSPSGAFLDGCASL